MTDLIAGIEGGDQETVLTREEDLIIKKALDRVPEKDRTPSWIIHGFSHPDDRTRLCAVKDIDLDSRDFKHLHDIIKKVYKSLREKNKLISTAQRDGMYSIMVSRPSRLAAVVTSGGDMLGRGGGGYMNGARKKSKRSKSKRRRSKRRKSKKRKSKKRKTKRRS